MSKVILAKDIEEGQETTFGTISEVVEINGYEVIVNVAHVAVAYDPLDEETYDQYALECDDEVTIYN